MTGRPHRIVVVLQTPPVSEASFEPVLRIARRTEARVEGVFVEDSRLLEIAALPSARFIHSWSRESSVMDEGIVRRALRVTAGRARQEFAARITASAIPWSFVSRPCADLSEAFGEATPGDLVVVPLLRDGRNIGQVADLIGAIVRRIAVSLLVLNERGAPASSILVLFDGDLDDLGAALDLAENLDCRATILAVADSQPAAEALAHKARGFLDLTRRNASVETRVYDSAADLDRAIRTAAPGILVVDRKGRTAATLDLATLLATSTISLYLRN
jgi:hypothetical protein